MAAFDTLVRLTGSLFPPLSGETAAPDSPALQALRLELLPYLLLTRSAERMYRKPRALGLRYIRSAERVSSR